MTAHTGAVKLNEGILKKENVATSSGMHILPILGCADVT